MSKNVTADFSKLRRYQGQLRPNIAAAINDANQTIKTMARELAPVSDEGSGGNPPGFLRDNIHITKAATAEDLKSETSSLARYSRDVELGTVEHGDAQPYMSPAYEAGKQQLIENLKNMGASRRPPGSLGTVLAEDS